MTDLLLARILIGYSLVFQVIFAVVGIGLPLLMVIAEYKWIRSKEDIWLSVTQRWGKGCAILFAIGAVCGTVIAFELGLLWPNFVTFSGSIIGLTLTLAVLVFFVEAIFLGIYLYGWNKVSRRAHLSAGVIVVLCSALSGVLVVLANAWMHTPAGFEIFRGQAIHIDPIAAMFNRSALSKSIHSLLSAYIATGFAVAGVHAFMLLKRRENLFHRKAFKVAFAVGSVALLLQLVSGIYSTRFVAKYQPIQLAAMSGQVKTESGAPLRFAGIQIPKALSLLAHGELKAEVKGLDSFPSEHWPPAKLVQIAFQVMLVSGIALLFVTLWAFLIRFRSRNIFDSLWFLRACALATPLGFIALEAGWMTTELARQPWIIRGVMLTSEAVTPMEGLLIPLLIFSSLFIALSILAIWLMAKLIEKSPFWPMKGDEHARP